MLICFVKYIFFCLPFDVYLFVLDSIWLVVCVYIYILLMYESDTCGFTRIRLKNRYETTCIKDPLVSDSCIKWVTEMRTGKLSPSSLYYLEASQTTPSICLNFQRLFTKVSRTLTSKRFSERIWEHCYCFSFWLI